jgi:PAS domain S-box-containing protein
VTTAGTGLLVERRYRRRDGTSLPAEVSFTRLPDGRLQRTIRDISSRLAAERARERLAAAVEQTSDSVLITDLAGTVDYVNPAFERISGYRADEVIGQTPRLLKSGRHSAGLYRALWRKLVRGETWTGSMVNRRKDGALYEVEATISPIHGPDGAITGFVGVERDVTAVRSAESALAAAFRERTQVAAALGRLQPAPTAEETAAEICGELATLPGIDAVAIFDLRTPGEAITRASDGPDGLPFSPGRGLPATRAAYLHGRALQGPWAEAWQARPEDGAYGTAMTEVGIKASAFAPIRNGDGLLGLVAAGTCDEGYARHLIDHLRS